MRYRLIEPASKQEWDQYYQLRYDVLRKPWNQPFSTTKDNHEKISKHFLILSENGEPIASGRLQINSTTEGQIRSMAVKQDWQGKGLGKALVGHIESIARSKKLSKIVLDARENAVPFYSKSGYVITAESYLLFGVIKHFRMEKML